MEAGENRTRTRLPVLFALALFYLFIEAREVNPVWAAIPANDSAADIRASAVPVTATHEIATLAHYLTNGLNNDREKARAIYYWITHNISYDLAKFGEKPDPARVLKQRRAVCGGFAALFKALAEAAGLTATIIPGEAKGRGPQGAITPEGLLRHEWNAVRIDGSWQLVDCAWGAGYLDEKLRFVSKFTNHYFLTPPKLFIYDHFPREPRWQLLATPLSRREFLQRVPVKAAFFEHKLQLLSHHQARLTCADSLTITLGAPSSTLVAGSLLKNGRVLDETFVFSQREKVGFKVYVSFPAKGSYLLRLFARQREAAAKDYELVAEYRIDARAGKKTRFPKMFGNFQERECYLEEPRSGLLSVGNQRFTLHAPGAEEVVVRVNQKNYRPASSANYLFSSRVKLEPGTATVFARFPGKSKYEGLLHFHIK